MCDRIRTHCHKNSCSPQVRKSNRNNLWHILSHTKKFKIHHNEPLQLTSVTYIMSIGQQGNSGWKGPQMSSPTLCPKWSAMRSDQAAPGLPTQLWKTSILPHWRFSKYFSQMQKQIQTELFFTSGTAVRKFNLLPLTFLSNFFCFIFSLLSRRSSFASCNDSSLPQTSRERSITYRMDINVFLFPLKRQK